MMLPTRSDSSVSRMPISIEVRPMISSSEKPNFSRNLLLTCTYVLLPSVVVVMLMQTGLLLNSFTNPSRLSLNSRMAVSRFSMLMLSEKRSIVIRVLLSKVYLKTGIRLPQCGRAGIDEKAVFQVVGIHIVGKRRGIFNIIVLLCIVLAS